MRILRYLGLGLLVVALVVTSIGWYRATRPAKTAHFTGCYFDVNVLELTWKRGSSEVTPTVELHSDGIVVGLHTVDNASTDTQQPGSPGNNKPGGDLSVWVGNTPQHVKYADGTPLTCETTGF